MIYLYGYRDIERLTEERRKRAMTEFRRRQPVPQPRLETREADVVELVFGTHCDHDQIGA
jgi:hypothetical protein